jgi:hypothetical protein
MMETTPILPTVCPNTFSNRFSWASRTVYGIYRTVNTAIFKLTHIAGAKYSDIWNNQPAKVELTQYRFAFLCCEMALKGLACIVAEKQ